MSDRDRQLQDEVRRLSNRVRKNATTTNPARQHWYESYAPSVEPVAANFRPLHDVNNQTVLMPIHLQKAMDARLLSVWARDTAGIVVGYAFAIYRAVLPKQNYSKAEQAGAPPSGGGVAGVVEPKGFSFELVDTIGIYRAAAGGSIELHHIASPKDIFLDPDEHPFFLGIMVNVAATHELFAPAIVVGGPHCAYRAKEPSPIFGRFPPRTGITPVRVTPPHFVLRSALGARLYGDPVNG